MASLLSTVGWAQSPAFTLHVLRTLPGGQGAVASGINDLGAVVGTADSGGIPCYNGCATIWRDGEPTALGVVKGAVATEGYSINNAGQVAGIAEMPDTSSAPYEAVIWNHGTATLLPSPASQYPETTAYALSDSGQVVGVAYEPMDTFGDIVQVVWMA